MIRSLLIDEISGEVLEGNWDLVELWRSEPGKLIWVDLQDAPPELEADQLKAHFGIHPLALQDAQRDRHPPKQEDFGDHLFILLKGLDAETDGIKFGTIQLAMFIGERFLITRHSGESVSIDGLWQQCLGTTNQNSHSSVSLATRLSRLITDRYLNILFSLEARMDVIEEEINEKPTDKLLMELRSHRSHLKKLMRIMLYHEHIFGGMKYAEQHPLLGGHQHELVDVYEQTERAHSLASLYDGLAADMIDGYLSLASHRMNEVMKILTIITAIFIPIGFLAGLYGMNFDNIPELHSRYGYFTLLGIMATIVVGLLVLFRKKKWL